MDDWGAWEKQVDDVVRVNVLKEGKHLGNGCYVKDCFWSGYVFDSKFYLCLNDSKPMWEVSEEIMRNHCID